ncbi:S8 family serine peptidase [Sorangium sp. So ce269]
MIDDITFGNGKQTTGRKIVVLSPGTTRSALATTLAGVGTQMVVASDFGGAVPAETMAAADTVLLDVLNVMIVAGPSAAAATTVNALATEGHVITVEDEGYVFALAAPALERAQLDYLEGYRDGVQVLVDHLLDGSAPAGTERSGAGALTERRFGEAAPQPSGRGAEPAGPGGVKATDSPGAARGFEAALDKQQTSLTWGLSAIGMAASPFTGRGIRVAILDTGIDLRHPDFRDRKVNTRSFVPGEGVQDRRGHGMHTAGTACGPLTPFRQPRYGVASEAELYIGKVLSDAGSGTDGWILNGINWALASGCRVISMSLGAPREPMEAYRQAGQRALDRGAIIIAAAGNESRRSQGHIAPTGVPANSPTIFSVAAVDSRLRVADFSCGGKVEIAAPGVDVHSAWPMPDAYNRISGTSMATPHVAGVAALMMQADPAASGMNIWNRLRSTARQLNAPASDVGAGLVQAPAQPRGLQTLQGPGATDNGRPSPGAAAAHGASPPRESASPVPPAAHLAPGAPGSGSGTLPPDLADVIVVVRKEHVHRMDELARRLEEAGMVVDKVLNQIGIITGSAPASKLEGIRSVEGVDYLEKAGIYRLPPPDSRVQ